MEKREHYNVLSHLIGAAAAVAGLTVLVVFAALQGDPWKIVSFSVYGTCLLLLYLFSTLYHGSEGRIKALFRRFDHIAIYLLIAGTYTPFTLVTLRGVWGWTIFGVVWGLAVLGIVIDAITDQHRRILPVAIYVLMGWLAIAAIRPLLAGLSVEGFLWLLLGGLLYTFGIVFYALGKRRFYFHTVWHLFVLAGSAVHYVTIYRYVL